MKTDNSNIEFSNFLKISKRKKPTVLMRSFTLEFLQKSKPKQIKVWMFKGKPVKNLPKVKG